MSDDGNEFRRTIDGVRAELDQAGRRVARRGPVDLSALAVRVERLCGAATPDRRGDLEAVLVEVDALHRALMAAAAAPPG